MKFGKKPAILLNVVTPLLLGCLVYWADKFPFIPAPVRNYLPDGLWAYAFISCILIIWDRGRSLCLDSRGIPVFHNNIEIKYVFQKPDLNPNPKNMTIIKKNVLSCCTLIIFALFALSSKVAKVGYTNFKMDNKVEDPSDSRNYVELNDGSKVYGDKISWHTGPIIRDIIKIDDHKFKISETKGYRANDVYFIRAYGDYLRRIVHGTINVYIRYVTEMITTTDHAGFTHTTTQTRLYKFSQLGLDAPLVDLRTSEDIRKLVASCPIAAQMAGLTDKELKKEAKQNPNYINSIFDVFNNGCTNP